MQPIAENATLQNNLETGPVTNQERSVSGFDIQKWRKLRKALRLNQTNAAARVGIHRTYLVAIEAGKRIPSLRVQRAIAEFIEKAERKVPHTPWEQLRRSRSSTPPPSVREVPVLTWASAAQALSFEGLEKNVDERIETDCEDPNAFAITIEGDSMEPKFLAGDRVVFAPNSESRDGDVVFAKLNDGRVLFKYFHSSGPEGTRVKFVSENPNYRPIEVDRSDLTFLFPASELKRRLRR